MRSSSKKRRPGRRRKKRRPSRSRSQQPLLEVEMPANWRVEVLANWMVKGKKTKELPQERGERKQCNHPRLAPLTIKSIHLVARYSISILSIQIFQYVFSFLRLCPRPVELPVLVNSPK